MVTPATGMSTTGMSTTGMSSRAVQAERTRRQILETAQRLFADKGYDATSLQMIADELGLTKAAVYYHFRAKSEILREAMRPGIEWISVLLDEAALIRGRRARIEHLVNGYIEFWIRHRNYMVMGSTDPAAKRSKMDDKAVALRGRALALLFGEHPTASERLWFNAVFSLHESLPEFVDLTDEELRESARTALLHMLRVPS
jgi:AcrR family transcriptional regulator